MALSVTGELGRVEGVEIHLIRRNLRVGIVKVRSSSIPLKRPT
jgi:hypothetical protein